VRCLGSRAFARVSTSQRAPARGRLFSLRMQMNDLRNGMRCIFRIVNND